MNLDKHAWIGYTSALVLALAAVIIGESYKVAWVRDWLAPILMLLFFITLCTLTRAAPKGIPTRKGKVVWWARTAGLAGLIWLFINIDLIGEAPVSMRLMGLSWTMSPYGAGRFLELVGLVLGTIACGVSWMDHRREAAAAALEESTRGQTPSVPPAA
jgi:hypothetical protein